MSTATPLRIIPLPPVAAEAAATAVLIDGHARLAATERGTHVLRRLEPVTPSRKPKAPKQEAARVLPKAARNPKRLFRSRPGRAAG
jgi:hypothetical protein